MVTASPAVSPRVVAAIFMIQKPSVTAGTLLVVSSAVLFTIKFLSERRRPPLACRPCVPILYVVPRPSCSHSISAAIIAIHERRRAHRRPHLPHGASRESAAPSPRRR